jgi:uncharacterized membrane protein YjgN (DUF898 family)
MRDTPKSTDAPIAPVGQGAIAFAGDNDDFRRLVTKGAFYELVSAGFYRFWLATNIRRHLWSFTSLGGDALEYLGTGRELLFGFLFALAILAPVYLVYFLVGLEAERYKAFASAPLALFFVAFSQFAIYRARRYRLHRTAWRGLRFGMEGSGWAYAGRAMAWGLAVVLSLGLAWPWALAALERYKMRHTFYGDPAGGFVGTGGDFFKRAWWIWALAFLGAIALSVAFWLIENEPGEDIETAEVLLGLGLFAATMVVSCAGPFLYGAYKAIQWKWWLEGLRLGEARAISGLKAGAMIRNYWAMIGWCALASAAAGAIAWIIIFATLAASHAPSPGGGPPLLALLLGGTVYLVVALAYGVIFRIHIYQRVWKIVVASLTIHNLELARDVAMRPGTADALGEGFADSLDVVGF